MKKSPIKSYDVNGAAAFISEQIGAPVSPRTFARLPIPYQIILKRRIFYEADLLAFVEEQRANSPRRIGKSLVGT
jgi:hypothetical protein